MKNEYITQYNLYNYRPLLKVRGLSLQPCFSTMCIDLSIQLRVHVVKNYSVINLYNHGIIIMYIAGAWE